MSLNLGTDMSKFVIVRDVSMKFTFSEKVLFASLCVSQKTGNAKRNRETREILYDDAGNEIPERSYTYWEGRFVGNAFEAAKGLKNGQAINIINGWLDKTENVSTTNGKKYTDVFAVITEFELSDASADADPTAETVDSNAAFRAMNGDMETPFNGGRG